jgi:hypothetical protein
MSTSTCVSCSCPEEPIYSIYNLSYIYFTLHVRSPVSPGFVRQLMRIVLTYIKMEALDTRTGVCRTAKFKPLTHVCNLACIHVPNIYISMVSYDVC